MRLFFATTCLLLPLATGQALIDADVHVTPPDYKESMSWIRDTHIELRGTTLFTLIARAYSMSSDRIIGGPRRLEFDKYDVVAKMPPGAKTGDVPQLLRPLLAERFKLVVKDSTRPVISYALVQGNGKHKLKPAQGSESNCTRVQTGDQTSMRVRCKAYSTARLVGILGSLSNGSISTRIEDKTGLQGDWDFDLEVPQTTRNPAAVIEAVEKQLGLKLEQIAVDEKVLVIESVNTVPTANAPGVIVTKPTALVPVVLEVATIKPSAPGAKEGFLSLNAAPGGMQWGAEGYRLAGLIAAAYDFPRDRVVGVPAGTDGQGFDVVVKMSGDPGWKMDVIFPALQQMMKERFKLAAHFEDRPVDAYKLVAVRPKMAKADPANRASCKSGPVPGAKDPREQTPGRKTLYTCQNVTMEEFAERLQGMSGGFLKNAVVNATGLEGMFDFTLNYSPQTAAANASANAADAGPAPLAAADPSDNITFLEALVSQLGLKLELEKRPAPFLVVDHVEKMPTEN